MSKKAVKKMEGGANVTRGQVRDVVSKVLDLARDETVSAEKLRAIYELSKDAQREQARLAYVRAMTEMRPKLPQVEKDGVAVMKGEVRYRYPRLATAMATLAPVLYEHGFSVSWLYGNTSDKITVTCILQHIGGHSEECSLSAEADTSGAKNNVQAVGSTVTYLQRYTFFALLGLVAVDDEDKALLAFSETQRETEALQAELASVAEAAGIDREKMLQYLGVKSFGEITIEQARALLPRLKARVERAAKNGHGKGESGHEGVQLTTEIT